MWVTFLLLQGKTIYHGFDDVRFFLQKWVPDLDNYFVMLDLPCPDNITFMPPVYPALFESRPESVTRFGSSPLTQVLLIRGCFAQSIRTNLSRRDRN
jgi:hypothetical protein